ncbi:DEAD-box ATP-dependent RNA helicase 5 [Rhododendron vialii]|uniref:DEAD-box ATP-dependent RNA helicase 5 n=1 Tax=Rhododendron vialii TaxID=182163 RepID=UPI00265E93D4|nr:DEAD-box ATP-dependent RNA helicase 5 [Rhododendron vialii]
MGITDNHELEAQKKSKKQKRKLELIEPEVVVVEAKKEKKKKKNDKRGDGFVVDCVEGGEIVDGSAEVGEKKKKKDRKENKREKEEEFLGNGSGGIGKKEKKKHKEEREGRGLKNGLAPDEAKREVVSGSCEKPDGNNRNGAIVDGDERRSHGDVVVSGKDIKEIKYTALNSFAESGLPKEVLECCQGFEKPSPIQSHSWPFLLNNRDFIGIAATGSGKTLAFGVPAIMHILQKRKNKTSKRLNPLCLVLSPTRELAQQISDVLCAAGKPCGLQSVCVYGGTSKGPQISALKSGVDIVIGTPGRLKDLIEMGVCVLKEVSFVVLDEADRMLDMGFEPEVRSILSQTCSTRQMVMFSATWPLPVHQLAQEFMDPNPVKVVVGSEDLAANHDVLQIVEVLEDRARDERLVSLLEKYHKSQKNRVLVFVLYKMEAARVENMLQKKGWNVVSIHGDKAQHARTKALSLFKEGSCPLMIATDVAARGLDIPDVEVVINYSFPLTTEDYVHRIGRTGRAGKKGVAHTFFMKENKGLAGELVNVLREAGQIVPTALTNFGTHVKKKESKLYGAHFREIAADAPKAKKITFDSDNED